MPTIEISSLDDERLEPYRNLRQSRAQRGECLIAEGHLLVERLLASRATVLSVLAGRRRVEQLITTLPSEVPVFSVPDEWIDRLIGFNFHRGVLAHALRPANPTLTELIPASSPRLTLVACDAIQDPTNLGSLFRSCRALGVDAVLLSPQCADPYSRRVLRVSMGASLRQPWRQSADLVHDLNWLRDEAQCELVATVTDAGAESCRTFQREPRVALLFGNEGTGLSDEWLARCSRRITVPMAAGFDSLNVAVAAGILLYELSPLGGMAQKKGADQAGAMP